MVDNTIVDGSKDVIYPSAGEAPSDHLGIIEQTLFGWRWNGDITCRQLEAEIRRALDAAGLVIAPKEPTLRMLAAGHLHCRAEPQYSMDSAAGAWRSMIAALPRLGEDT